MPDILVVEDSLTQAEHLVRLRDTLDLLGRISGALNQAGSEA